MQHLANPMLPLQCFIPDVEAHVWAVGRIYLYGSMDLEGKMQYCCGEYHVYSSDDLIRWVDHGVCFDIGKANWADGHGALHAPDCAYRTENTICITVFPMAAAVWRCRNLRCGPLRMWDRLRM